VLLQIMDHGKLTDHNGKQVDFRNIILIMTTNAGASDLARAAYGFTRSKREGDDLEAINRLFAPEFRNRLDAIITFNHLTPEIIALVVEKFVLQLEAQLADRDVTIELSEEAAKWLIDRGYDEQMGARPMARVIQEHIKKPLADEVLFGKLKNGGHVRVVVKKEEAGAPGTASEAQSAEAESVRAESGEVRSMEERPGTERTGKAKTALAFEFLDGPITPKPEKIPPVRPKGKRRGSGGGGNAPRRAKPPTPRGDGGALLPTRGSVPKIPLVKV
jgi:ATP-dependent Clp protease ATP-binding subunit ClpA